jgi:hypothetical protein
VFLFHTPRGTLRCLSQISAAHSQATQKEVSLCSPRIRQLTSAYVVHSPSCCSLASHAEGAVSFLTYIVQRVRGRRSGTLQAMRRHSLCPTLRANCCNCSWGGQDNDQLLNKCLPSLQWKMRARRRLLCSSPQPTQQECRRASTTVAKVAVRIARLLLQQQRQLCFCDFARVWFGLKLTIDFGRFTFNVFGELCSCAWFLCMRVRRFGGREFKSEIYFHFSFEKFFLVYLGV